ncbi:MAG: tRNA (pseudouridine(54)-N(1))-methyltransferase TrmY, partial [Thermoplasmata archaeon]|nr:tRNA (pseudouridine(54)-N(1))-methyltransferase TrmY [Thermoplasmata archaeon]
MTRIFVVVGHRVRTDAKFNLNDLCGSTGRLDILLRAINSAFLLSNGLRRDVELYLVLK